MDYNTGNFCLTSMGQREFEKNIKLSHKLARLIRAPMGMSIDDWQQEVHKEFARAIALHDPKVGRLSTLAYRLVFLRWSNLNSKQRTRTQGLSTASIEADRNSDGATISDLLGVEDNSTKRIDDSDLADEVIRLAPQKYRRVLVMLRQEVKLSEIGRKLGFSRQYGSQSLAMVRAEVISQMGFDHVQSAGDCEHCGDPVVKSGNNSQPMFCPECARDRLLNKKKKCWYARKGKVSQ